MSEELRKAYAKGRAAAAEEGGVYIPYMLLSSYRRLGLNDSEAMLLIQMMAFRECERNEFPTPEQLADRLGVPAAAVVQLLRRMLKEGFLAIEEEVDPATGVQSERYNWRGWIRMAAEAAESERRVGGVRPARRAERSAAGSDLFTVFEQEFGRPLSPMECETISAWLDQDRYPEELIRFALKEAVFAGKLHFRYIDRILIEWNRNRVTTVEEAKAHSSKFRAGRG